MDPVIADAAALPVWGQVLITLVSLIITTLLVPLLRAKSAAARAEADKLTADATNTSLNSTQIVVERLKSFLFGTAEAYAERELPRIAQGILAGQYKTADAIKAELRGMGAKLKADAIGYFKVQGIDLVVVIGDQYIDKLIERAANAVSPFPGKETAVEMLQGGSAKLLSYGTKVLRDRYLSEAEGPSAAPTIAAG